MAVTAIFLGMQPTGKGTEAIALYNITGGPYDRSTVTAGRLIALGIPIPAGAK